MMSSLYFWLFKRAASSPVARLAWRRLAGALTASKHFQRGNTTEALRWLRWTFTAFCLAAAADTWVPIPGVPEPPCGYGTNWHRSNYTNAAFQFDYGAGLEAYRVDSQGRPYTHYIWPDHPSATDTANPFGTEAVPRLTRPNCPLTNGAVVYLNGGTLAIWGPITRNSGTDPIYICGEPTNPPTTLNGNRIECDNIVIEHIRTYGTNASSKFWQIGTVTEGGRSNINFRHNEFTGGNTNMTGGSYSALRIMHDWGTYDTVHGVVIGPSNTFHYIGYGRTTEENDAVGVSLDVGVSNVYFLRNFFGVIGGDGIQIASDDFTAGETNVIPNTWYAAENTFSNLLENGLDFKLTHTAVVTRNLFVDFGTPFGTLAGAGGESYAIRVAGQDVATGLAQSNIWFWGNTFKNMGRCEDGAIRLVSTPASLMQDVYIGFNTFLTGSNANGNAVALYQVDVGKTYWFNNTVKDFQIGAIFYGDRFGTNDALEKLTAVNNIFGELKYGGTNWLQVVGNSNSLARAELKNNLYYDSDQTPTFRVGIIPIPFGSATYSNYTWATLGVGDWSSWTNASLNADPLLQSNLRLTRNSPCADAGFTTDYAATYLARFGVDIAKDAAGYALQGGYPIGAFDWVNRMSATSVTVGTMIVNGP